MPKMSDLAAEIAREIRARAPFRQVAEISDLSAAYAIQGDVTRHLADELDGFAGFKIGWNTPKLLQAYGATEPAVARVFNAQVHQNQAELDPANYIDLMIEPEIMATLAHDPGPDPSLGDVVAAIDHFTPAFELLDRHGVSGPPHALSIIASNVFNAGAVVGEGGVDASALDPATLLTRVTEDATVLHDATDSAPQHPLEAARFVISHAHRRGLTVRPGDIVLCGTHTPLLPVRQGARYSMELVGVGTASFQFGPCRD